MLKTKLKDWLLKITAPFRRLTIPKIAFSADSAIDKLMAFLNSWRSEERRVGKECM